VLLNGRVQPFDSVARNSLLLIRGQVSVPLEGNGPGGAWGEWGQFKDQGGMTERKWYQFGKRPKRLKPTEWILEVMCRSELADQRPIFLLHHPDLLGELRLDSKGVENSGLRYFTFLDLAPHLEQIEKEARQISSVKPEVRNPYQKSVMNLHGSLQLYLRLKNSLKPERSPDFAAELAEFERLMTPGLAAVKSQQAGQPYDEAVFKRFLALAEPYAMMAERAHPLLIPPAPGSGSREDWSKLGKSLLDSIHSGTIHPAVTAYATIATAYASSDIPAFNRHVREYQDWLSSRFGPELRKGREEHYFNVVLPFYRSMMIYVVAMVFAAASWINNSKSASRTAYVLAALAFIVHTAGLLFRMYLERRPPVTNLYSSAIFVGWAAVLLGLILERIYRDGIGTFTSATIGFVTLIIAHHLSMGGDTMEMLRAVLDTNFWLATHVVVITAGYSATFLAGFLAIVYVLRGVLTRTLSAETAQSLTRMVYGIVCFATLASFVGTILGGIWADQSWGRFWGWDPKENGALLIVIWNATILHARWGGMVRERGLMNLAILGNIVTAWSWFGVNMLGIGLHSYGFMDAAFKWLVLFATTQVVVVALGLLPRNYWASFRTSGSAPAGPGTPPRPSVPKPGAAAA
jgi:ABC-type transport system involved in cytochrome c biogenesis permease subunit